ncbi:hypothetical protein BDZ91DRAFT_751931 [Kalaharituber pfeilii]|nr:hypothetical protein BDZ91DRAFT_751931 [Kalaharituber pfeilii]
MVHFASKLLPIVVGAVFLARNALCAPLEARKTDDPCTHITTTYFEKGITKIPAKEAYACLIGIIIDKELAQHTLEQTRKFSQILSSQVFFKHPEDVPLNINRVDLNGTLDAIEKKISSKYTSEYEFGRDLAELFGSYHDGHTMIVPRCTVAFGTFEHDYPLVAIVEPGETEMRIHLADSVTGEVGDEVVEIAGEPAMKHLLDLVLVLKGPSDAAWIDADTRWNELFVYRGVTVSKGNFAARDLYPGEDFHMKLASGKVIDVHWYVHVGDAEDAKATLKDTAALGKACRTLPPAPEEDNEEEHEENDDETDDTYEPEDEDEDEDQDNTQGSLHRTNHGNSGTHHRPKRSTLFGLPEKLRKRISTHEFTPEQIRRISARDGSTVEDFSDLNIPDTPPQAMPPLAYRMNATEQSLYLLNDNIAVWGFHSMLSNTEGVDEIKFFYYWRSYMINSIELLKTAGIKKVILDFTNNGGGSVVLGMETVRRFFPEAEPFYGVTYRRNPQVDTYIEDTNVTVALNDMDGNDWESLEAFLEPKQWKDDFFTQIGRFDQLSNSLQEIPGVEFTFTGPPPFAKEDMVILTNGACGSTCAIVVEALTSIGVASIAVGGQPLDKGHKTMQVVGGIKGYQVADMTWWGTIKDELEDDDPSKPYFPEPFKVAMAVATMNLRNSYDPSDTDIPLEFQYQPANGHLWYTSQMINDKRILWNDVARMAWDTTGKNLLLNATSTDSKNKSTKHKHRKQPQASYKGMSGPQQKANNKIKEGLYKDFGYLSSTWISWFGGRK